MVLESVTVTIREGENAAFEAAFAEASEIVAASSGFRFLELHRGLEDARRYALLIEWDSVADHMDGFRNAPGYERWRELLHPFYDGFPTGGHFEAVLQISPCSC